MNTTVIALKFAIALAIKNNCQRKDSIILRQNSLQNLYNGLVKVAFDTRNIDQQNDYIPRRSIKNYLRSDEFISQSMQMKLDNLKKLQNILLKLQQQHQENPAWQESYTRVLLKNVENILNNTHGFTDAQPATGSLDYLEELLYVRYRLDLSLLTNLSEEELEKIIISKEHDLKNTASSNVILKNNDMSFDANFFKTLFGGVKATTDNKEVERTITITIKDKIVG